MHLFTVVNQNVYGRGDPAGEVMEFRNHIFQTWKSQGNANELKTFWEKSWMRMKTGACGHARHRGNIVLGRLAVTP